MHNVLHLFFLITNVRNRNSKKPQALKRLSNCSPHTNRKKNTLLKNARPKKHTHTHQHTRSDPQSGVICDMFDFSACFLLSAHYNENILCHPVGRRRGQHCCARREKWQQPVKQRREGAWQANRHRRRQYCRCHHPTQRERYSSSSRRAAAHKHQCKQAHAHAHRQREWVIADLGYLNQWLSSATCPVTEIHCIVEIIPALARRRKGKGARGGHARTRTARSCPGVSAVHESSRARGHARHGIVTA